MAMHGRYHGSRCVCPHASAPTVPNSLQWQRSSVIVGQTCFGDVEKGLFIAKGACWWIFWQSPPCIPAASIPSMPPRPSSSYLSYCRCGLERWQDQVRIDGTWDEEREKREKESGRIDGTQVASWTPVFLFFHTHLHRQNGFLPSSDLFFLSLSFYLLRRHHFISNTIFVFILPLLFLFPFLRTTSTSSLCLCLSVFYV